MTVWGRVPAGLILAASSGKTVPVLVDGDGVVYKIGTTGAEVDLPVISGLTAGDPALGAALPRAYGPLFAGLRALRESAPALYALVSEIRVVDPPPSDASAPHRRSWRISGQLEVLVWLTCSPIPVRARGWVDEALLRSTLIGAGPLVAPGCFAEYFRSSTSAAATFVYRTKGG